MPIASCVVFIVTVAAAGAGGAPDPAPAEAAAQPVAATLFGDARILAWAREILTPPTPLSDEAVVLWRQLAAVPAQPDAARALSRFCGVLEQSITREGPPRVVYSGESWTPAISCAALRRRAVEQQPWRRCLETLCDRLAEIQHHGGDAPWRERDRVEALWQCRLELAGTEPPGKGREALLARALAAQKQVDVDRQQLLMREADYGDAARAAGLAQPGRALASDHAAQEQLDAAARARADFLRLPLVWHIHNGCLDGMEGTQADEDLEVRVRARCAGESCSWLRLIACASVVPLEDAARSGEARPAPPGPDTLAELRRVLALPAFGAWAGPDLVRALGRVIAPSAPSDAAMADLYGAVRDAAAARLGLQSACMPPLSVAP